MVEGLLWKKDDQVEEVEGAQGILQTGILIL